MSVNTATLVNSFGSSFQSHVCYGDTITATIDGFDITARVIPDECTSPREYDCYDDAQIKAWREGEWWFCGIVLSVSKNDVVLDHYAASLWGIEANFPLSDNSYLTEVANELLDEALKSGQELVEKLCSCKEVA